MGGYSGVKYSTCQDLPKFQFGGRGGILESNTQSAKICLNFKGGGWYSGVKYSKCQDLPKFQFFGGKGVLLNQIPEEGVLENLVKNFTV